MPPKKRKAESSKDQEEKERKRRAKGKEKAKEKPGEPMEIQHDDDDDFQQSDILEAIRLSRQVQSSTGSAGAGPSTRPLPPTRDDDDDFQDPIPLPRRRTPIIRTTTRASTSTAASTATSTTPVTETSVASLSQEIEERLSIAPEPSTSDAPAFISKKIEMKKKRAEAKKEAREEASKEKAAKGKPRDTTGREETRQLKAGRRTYVVKTGLKGMLKDDLNEDQKQTFVNLVRQVTRHISDVTYAASLFLNWFCLRKLSTNEAIPRLDHNYLYNFAALFIGQGKNAPPDVQDAFRIFQEEMGESLNIQQQFPNMKYTTIITVVIKSFETLIANHVSSNFKSRTLRYLFVRISSAGEPSYLHLAVGVKRNLCDRMYTAITSGNDMIFPKSTDIGDNERTSIRNMIEECRQQLHGLLMTEEHCYAYPHLYLPWLYRVLMRMEQHIAIQEPVSAKKATKGFVHRELDTIINFRRLPGKFRNALEHHVKMAINSENQLQPFVDRTYQNSTKRSSAAADRLQMKNDDLLHDEKVAIDDLVMRTRVMIRNRVFRPMKYTDPRGARLFNLLPIHSLEMRYITINETALKKMVRDSRVITLHKTDNYFGLCWKLFKMAKPGFNDQHQLHRTSTSRKSFTAIRTDGVAIEFVCERPAPAPLDDITPAGIADAVDLDNATIWGVDPGQRDIFVASDGDETAKHRVRKTSTKEYYQMAGYNSAKIKRAKYDHAHRLVRNLIAQKPSTKTANQESFNDALRYIFTNFTAISNSYNHTQRNIKFTNYGKRQKTLNKLCKRLFCGSSKYQEGGEVIHQTNQDKWKPLAPYDQPNERRRPIIVAFGAARFGNLRGNVPAPTKLLTAALLNHLKKPAVNIQRNDLYGERYLVMINEYYTSQICPICQTHTTDNQVDADDMQIHSVLKCETCDTQWNRDHMASMNIRSIFLHMARNNNERPGAYREEETET